MQGPLGNDTLANTLSSPSTSPAVYPPMRAVNTQDRLVGRRHINRSASPRLSLSVSLLTVISFGCLLLVSCSYRTSQPVYPAGSLAEDARGGGAGSCRMSYMSPAYLRLDGFGREYTRLGSGPWGLYLYREVGWDNEPITGDSDTVSLALKGTPIIFVPGNAGSFRQVRSLASAASRGFWEVPGIRRKGVGSKEGGKNLDFFTLDFNDDFSAFHGQTLLDQSEYLADSIRYILSLYHQKDVISGRPDPTAVMVVAHSMGGVVARAAFLHPHYQRYSISTLITIATPHIVPPVTVDRGVDAVYNSINSYWRKGYFHEEEGRERDELKEVVMISIGGGLSDVTIASESASLSSILPLNNSNGFTAFTTTIPGVNTPIDHLAILWCEQLMQLISRSLLAIVDVRSPTGVLPRDARVSILSEKLLGGLESRTARVEGRKLTLSSLERDKASRKLNTGERLVIRPNEIQDRTTFILPIPETRTYTSARIFSLLTSSTIGRGKDSAAEVYVCGGEGELVNSAAQYISSEDTELHVIGERLCTSLFPSHVSAIPASPHSPTSPILPSAVNDHAMGFLSVDVAQLDGLQYVLVVFKPGKEEWVIAEFGNKEKSVQIVDKSAFQILLSGFKIEHFPSTPRLVSEIWIPALDTSLITFKLQMYRSECQETKTLFAPLIRQFSPLLHESKYYPNSRIASLYTHSSGPFIPSPASPFLVSDSRLQIFLDPTCQREHGTATESSDVAIEITVDVWATLGSLAMRYRMAAVAFPFCFVMLVLGVQLSGYQNGDVFMPFGTALSKFVRSSILPLFGILSAASFFQAVALGRHLSYHDAMAFAADVGHIAPFSLPSPWMSDLLLGNHGFFFILLAAFLAFTGLSVVVLEYLALQSMVSAAAWAVGWIHRRGPASLKAIFALTETREILPTQRILGMIALLLIVLLFAPYQFAFLVMFLVHFFSTTRSLISVQDSSLSSFSSPSSSASGALWDMYHYSFSILFVMTTLLPINALILVVWVRNLAVGWLAPFSSDHNVFAVVGFLLHIEALHSGKMLLRVSPGVRATITSYLPVVVASIGFLYGIRYTHTLYPLTNGLFLWLAANHSDALVGAVEDVVRGKRRQSIAIKSPDESGSHLLNTSDTAIGSPRKLATTTVKRTFTN